MEGVVCEYNTRLNRNIVECKGDMNKKGTYPNAVLIETLWNVKCCFKNY